MSEEFKAITTQEEFDKAVQARVLREQETLSKKFADYDQLKARNTVLESENSALQGTINESKAKYDGYDKTVSDLNAKVAGYETANLKTQIALNNGIPYDLAGRLVGDDEASIKADAERLAGFISKPTAPPLGSTEPKSTSGKDSAYKNLLNNLNLEGE